MDTNEHDNATGGLPLFDRRRRIQALREKVEELKDGMEPGKSRTRGEVAEGILNPLLTQLGWDLADPRVVVSGFETGLGTVDFALCHPPGDPRILVKIEAPADAALGEDAHPFNDCSVKAIQLAILGGGRRWRFHFGAGRGRIRNREFARFHIVRDPEEQVAEALDEYLAFHRVRSGEAVGLAEREYSDERFPAEASAAWRRSLLGSEILERFVEEMGGATGVAPSRDRAEAFVRGQVDGIQWPADPPDPKPARRVAVGDKVWIYDFASREIVIHVVVDREPDWDQGEVSRASAIGHALLGAREGEDREARFAGGDSKLLRIVLIRG